MNAGSQAAPPKAGSRAAEPARRGTLLVTNVTKLAGVAVVLHEVWLRGDVRPATLAVAAFMMAGAQLSETVVLATIDRFLGRNDGNNGR